MDRPTDSLKPHPWSVSIYGDTRLDGALLESIRESGILEPLSVKEDGTIISGHRRWATAKQLGLEMVPVVLVQFDNELQEHQAILYHNYHRHETFSQSMRVAEALEEIESERARQRMLSGKAKDPVQTFAQGHPGRTRDIVAHAIGFGSGETYRKAKALWTAAKQGDPKALELVERLDQRDGNVDRALKELRLEEKLRPVRQKISTIEGVRIEEPSGEYDVLVLDPPWPMQVPQSPGFDYPTMSEEQLAALKIPAAPDCHLWLWTIPGFLPMAFRLLQAWGFEYKCPFVWFKPGGMQPSGLPQYNLELALYAQRGKPILINTVAFALCFQAPRGKHSEKPEKFYDIVRRATVGKRLDMFGRRRIRGFDSWGKEAPPPRPSTGSFFDDPDYYRYVLPYLAGFNPHACAGDLRLCPNYALLTSSFPISSGEPGWLVDREAQLGELGLGPEGTEDEDPDLPPRIGISGV